VFSTPDQGGDDTLDSDANSAGLTQTVTLTSGQFNSTLDAGLVELPNPTIAIEKFVRVDENPIALKKLVAVEPIGGGAEGQMVCQTEGKPEVMVFKYDPNLAFDTNQAAGKGGIVGTTNVLDDDPNAYIVVTDDSDPTNGLTGKIFFAGNVTVGEEFSASIANAGTSFGSNTFIYFFDQQNGPLLQSLQYHTSCSTPITLGDKALSATLVGYDGVDGNSLVRLPSPTFLDANTAPGLETLVGSTVNFRYEVTNTGNSSISNVVLTDNRIANITFVGGDIDNDSQLDTNETWIYSATEVAGTGLVINQGTVTGTTANGQTTIATDIANYTGVTAPAGNIGSLGQQVCQTGGKPEVMVFKYDPNLTFDTNQAAGKGGILTNVGLDDDNNAYIVVTDDSDPTNGLSGKTFFAGNVTVGSQFSASITNAGATFGSNTFIYFFDQQGGPLLQSVQYHTSCSTPITLGDKALSATLVGYDGVNGGLISLPTSTGPVVPPISNPVIQLPQIDAIFDVNNIGVTGDTAPGVVAQRGDIVTFTYQVTNTGNVDLTLDNLVDDNATPGDTSDDFTPTYVEGDVNGDSIFNPGEVWYFQAKELATRPGLNTNMVKVTAADAAGTTVTADDPANYLINPLDIEKLVAIQPIGAAEEGLQVCQTEGKPEVMVFKYDPNLAFDTNQAAGKGGIVGTTNVLDDDPNAYIVVTDDSDPTNGLTGKTFFAGNVTVGSEFSASITNAGSTFGSNTFIYFFDEQNGPLLQSLQYHTSCSTPITLGDKALSATLVGYDGVNGSNLVRLPSPTFVDADTLATAPEAVIGTQVEYQYVVRNLGTEALSNVVVSDDKLGTPTYVEGDANNNSLLDAGEEWIYTATETAVKGDRTNTATATASLMGIQVTDADSANYIGIKLAAPTGDLENLFGKPTQMTFTYIGGNLVSTGGKDKDGNGFGDQDGNAKIESGTGDNDPSAYIIVSNKNNIAEIKDGRAKTYFAGKVEIGQSFSADLDFLNQDKFENDTRVLIFEDEAAFRNGLTPLQVMKYKTDGSQDMTIGDIIGGVQLVEYVGQTNGFNDPELNPLTGKVGTGFYLPKVLGSAKTLTFSYTDTNNDGIAGGVDVLTGQGDKAKISGIQDNDPLAYFLVSNKSNPFDSGAKIYFKGVVNLNNSFTASLDFQGVDKFEKDTFIYLFDDLASYSSGSSSLQTMQYKTDGSEPMMLKDQLGGLTLTGYASTTGLAALI
ncbi:hypothetical protein, partial [Anabaena sp. CCY 9402-a]|uniref:DUF7467 domain-containing protein n=1 Tax=Anabaena sp. CCY 9402-a TaxID=3103867 RepID=UPI0039C6BC87